LALTGLKPIAKALLQFLNANYVRQPDRAFPQDTLNKWIAAIYTHIDFAIQEPMTISLTTTHTHPPNPDGIDTAIHRNSHIHHIYEYCKRTYDRIEHIEKTSSWDDFQPALETKSQTIRNTPPPSSSVQKRHDIQVPFVPTTEIPHLILFYRNQISTFDKKTFFYSLLMSKENEYLEENHDYIQWVFPNPLPSGSSSNCPELDSTSMGLFLSRNDNTLRDHMVLMFLRMLKFYDLNLRVASGLTVFRLESWGRESILMTHSRRHNYLRITRILISLSLLGLTKFADAFRIFLTTEYRGIRRDISRETIRFWNEAISKVSDHRGEVRSTWRTFPYKQNNNMHEEKRLIQEKIESEILPHPSLRAFYD
jgi:hypothetical protein